MDYTVACQARLSMGFSRQGYWSGLPSPSPGDLPNPGTELTSPASQRDSLPSEPPGRPLAFRGASVTISHPVLAACFLCRGCWVDSMPGMGSICGRNAVCLQALFLSSPGSRPFLTFLALNLFHFTQKRDNICFIVLLQRSNKITDMKYFITYELL